MAEVKEIIEYMKSLKRGFNIDLFASKIEELAHYVDTIGLDYEDFHTLIKVWLNLSIPLTRWSKIGVCLVPQSIVEERTVDYIFRWILTTLSHHSNFTRIAFVLDWLTATMDCQLINMNTLDYGYEIFFYMLMFEGLAGNAVKLVYTLTKPTDVTRRRVLELLHYKKKRDGKKKKVQEIITLLGLFKSYKPECVPENIPALCINNFFRKQNETLMNRLKRSKARMDEVSLQKHQHLMWTQPFTYGQGQKKRNPLVPDLEFCAIGSSQYTDEHNQKKYIDFTDPVTLIRYSVNHKMCRPTKLRALLCNPTGLLMLTLATDAEQAFLSYDLQHTLTACFLDENNYTYKEKQYFLISLTKFQRVLLQGIPVVTMFLAEYLPLWNEKDYFAEILQLVEWIDIECPHHVEYILQALTKTYHRVHPIVQCAILRSLTSMYTNLVYASTRKHQFFMSLKPSQSSYVNMLPKIASTINDMCNKALQVNPEDMRVNVSCLWWSTRSVAPAPAPLVPIVPLVAATTLLQPSAMLLEMFTNLLLLYKKIMKKASTSERDENYMNLIQTLKGYTYDMIASLYFEDIKNRAEGIVFSNLPEQLVKKTETIIPEMNSTFGVRNNLAFATIIYSNLRVGSKLSNANVINHMFVSQELPALRQFLNKLVP